MESRAVRAAPFRGLRHTLRRREPGGPRRQAEVARRRVRWDRFPGIGRANTATKWAGVEWTMVMWPVPQYKQPRMRLMLHECFHRVQAEIGLEEIGRAHV